MRYDVVGIGGLYLDVIAHVSYDFVREHNIVLDREQEIPAASLSALFKELKDIDYAAGGSVSNSIAGISALGGLSGIFGKVANDAIGDFLCRDLEGRNVEFCCPQTEMDATISPLCIVVLTPNGERSIIYNRSCAASLSDNDFAPHDFSKTKILLIESDLLRDPLSQKSILNAAGLARTQQTKVVLNLQGFDDWKDFPHLPAQIVDLADIIIGNEEESEAFAGYIESHARAGQLFISTKGEKGVSAYSDGKTLSMPAIPPKNFVSAIGAGDQFIAGFIKGILDHGTLQDNLNLGVRMATSILEEKGGRPHIESLSASPLIISAPI